MSIVGDGTESEPSAVVRYVLDNSKPKVTITSPKANAVVNGKSATIKGKTQAPVDAHRPQRRPTAAIDRRDRRRGRDVHAELPIATGQNTIDIVATDPAGNATDASLTVRRGYGKLTVVALGSPYQVPARHLPEGLRLTVSSTDPDGDPLKGAA